MNDFAVRVWNDKKMDYDCRDLTVWNGVLVSEGDGIIMRCSPFSDRVYRKIFEGDIIKDMDGQIWKVLFSDGCFKAKKGPRWKLLVSFIAHSTVYCEVVGNVFENPRMIVTR